MKTVVTETERLRIRLYNPESQRDVKAAFALYSDPQVIRYLGQSAPESSLDSQKEKLVKVNEKYLDHAEGHGFWAVETKKDPRVIGTILLKNLPDEDGDIGDDTEIGWHFHPLFWGQGYATEASQAILEYAFTRTPNELINAVVHSGNDRSKRVALRLGMSYKGTTKRYYGGTLLDLYSITRAEWQKEHDHALFLGNRKSASYSSTLLRRIRLTKVAEG